MVLCSEFLLRFYSFVNSGRNVERISTPMIACLFKSNILGLANSMITLHLVSTSEGLGSMASTTHKSLSSDLTYTKHSACFCHPIAHVTVRGRGQGCARMLTGCWTDEMMSTPRERASRPRCSTWARLSWERSSCIWTSLEPSSSAGCARSSSSFDLMKCISWNSEH